LELTDPVIMTEVREDLQIGAVTPLPECAKGIEAKFRIADVLGIDINCVQRFKAKTSI
jgi:dimethylamine--corrinoid protein Co-methyltransferase